MKKDFGSRLSRVMELKNVRQNQLARATGVTEATVSRYVNNRRMPDINFVRNAARMLGVSADYLLGFEEFEPHTAKMRMRGRPRTSPGVCSYQLVCTRASGERLVVEIADEKKTALLDQMFEMLFEKGEFHE